MYKLSVPLQIGSKSQPTSESPWGIALEVHIPEHPSLDLTRSLESVGFTGAQSDSCWEPLLVVLLAIREKGGLLLSLKRQKVENSMSEQVRERGKEQPMGSTG